MSYSPTEWRALVIILLRWSLDGPLAGNTAHCVNGRESYCDCASGLRWRVLVKVKRKPHPNFLIIRAIVNYKGYIENIINNRGQVGHSGPGLVDNLGQSGFPNLGQSGLTNIPT